MEKLKLNLQLFSSTNKTTYYELSQYIGTDKPTYLVDYNGDMGKIDSALHTIAGVSDTASAGVTANSTAIGTLANLTTESKTNLVGAINEVDSHADTNATNIATNTSNIGTLSNLKTTAKTNLVSGINEVFDMFEVFNLSNHATLTLTTSTDTISYSDMSLAYNSDGSLFKVYGEFNLTGNTSGGFSVSASSPLRPTENYTIAMPGIAIDNGGSVVDIRSLWLNVKTDGTLEFVGSKYTNNMSVKVFPCLYFNKNFGDTPQA